MKAKKALGQNFLIDNYYINSIIDAVNVFSDDLIIEIGPGRGALTSKLTKKGCELIAYELDTDLKKYLDKLINDKTKIIYQDFLASDLKEIKNINKKKYIVGNLPYYITTPIIEHIIETKIDPEEIVIMVQKEVTDRFLAEHHSKEYGYFTLYLKYYFEIEKVIDVPASAFSPAPKVNSTVIKLKRRINKPLVEPDKYFKFLKDCFKQKRKQLKNNLVNYDYEKVREILNKYNMPDTIRAEELHEEILIDIVNNL